MRDFSGKVAVVTGAASGIGRALAIQLSRLECNLALVDIDGGGLDEAAALARKHGTTVTTHCVDVSDKRAMAALPETVIEQHGHVHLLVNNAGVSVSASFRDHSLEDFEWLVGINFWGVVYGCKFFLPYLERESEAHIVNLSSVFGLVGLPSQISYAATKFAVRGFSESLAADLADGPVSVTSVHPGGVDTNIVRSSRSTSDFDRERVIEQFNKRAMSPDRAAMRIIDAIRSKKLRVLICRETYVTDWMRRLLPSFSHRVITSAMRRAGISA